MKVEARKLKGFRDHLPEQALIKNKIIESFKAHASAAGFLPIETPALEYADVLLGSSAAEIDKEVYRFVDHGERDVALRYDLTVPFARFVSENYAHLPMPFKKIQVGEVWRGEKPQKGRYRQFCQADVDIVGADSLISDLEILQTMVKCLAEVCPSPLIIRVNDRRLLSGLIKTYLGDQVDENKILIAIDKLEKIGPEAVTKLIDGDPVKVAQLLSQLRVLTTADEQAWQQLAKSLAADVVNRVYETLSLAEKTFVSAPHQIVCDLRIARGLAYYTGIVFETNLSQLPEFGSVASGGRYDNLVDRFGKYQLTGVGGSIGVDRLAAALEELKVPTDAARSDFFVAIASDDATAYAWEIVHELRESGFRADIAVKLGKLGQQFKYADQLKIPIVITVGGTELQSQTFSAKILATGEQLNGVARSALVSWARDRRQPI